MVLDIEENCMRYVKFYSEYDLSSGFNLKRLEEIYNEFNSDATYTLNQILELHNCTIYIDRNLFLEKWDNDYKSFLKETNGNVKTKIARFFTTQDENGFEDLDEIQFYFKEDFLELFLRFKLDQRIPKEVINLWLNEKVFSIYTICQNKLFVSTYSDLISDVIFKDVSNAEIIIEKYLKKKTNEKELYLPNLNPVKVNALINDYIDSSEVNSNYLRLLTSAGSVQGFKVTPEMKLKAKKKLEKETEELFSKTGGFQFEHIVSFKRNLDQPMKADINSEKGKFKIEIDKTWLESETDNYTIIYNFIWLFGYLDQNGRIGLVNLKSEGSALLDALGITGKFDYKTNHTFLSKEIFSQMELNGYYEILQSLEIELERIIEWYFNDYLKAEFNIENYIVELPSSNATYREKCLALFPEIEYILVQFDKYVKYKYISQELIAEDSNGILFSQVSSLLDTKYIYPTKELHDILFYLFSDQSSLNYIEEDLKAKNFFELITSNNVKLDDFHNYQQRLVKNLLEISYLVEDDFGIIRWANPYKIILLNELYKNEVIVVKRLSKKLQMEANLLINEGLVTTDSKLFSTLEQDYFDYYLNNHKFQNGLQLRNKYMHRRQVLLEEQQHKQNYLIGLKLLICIMLKINEEFCLAYDEGLLNTASHGHFD